MKYLKKFEVVSKYDAYKSGSDFVLPNVSLIGEDVVMYNPLVEPISSYVMVDLGLPSGLKWADRNIGASSSEDYGLYFQWGDTVGYTAEQVANGEKAFNLSDYFDTTDDGYTFNKYAIDKLTVLEGSDDAATVNMGSDWRMPTETEMQELINNTTPTFIDLQGNEFSQSEAENGAIAEYNLKGVRFTGSNGNSIFIPASGYCDNLSFNDTDNIGCLWSSSFSFHDNHYSMFATRINLYYGGWLYTIRDGRGLGIPVRGVHA